MRDPRKGSAPTSRLGLLSHPSVISIGLAAALSGIAISSINIYRYLIADQASTYISPRSSSTQAPSTGPLDDNILACWQAHTTTVAYNGSGTTALPNSNVTDPQQLLALAPAELENKITSSGERSLIKEEGNFSEDLENLTQKVEIFSKAKTEGTTLYAQGEYQTAANKFKAARDIAKNSPESLIYLNNALANTASKSYSLGIAVPLKMGLPSSELETAMAILKGAAHAQDDINGTGGIKGIPIKLLLVDDFDNSPQSAEAVAQILTKKKDVLGVVGHDANSATVNARRIYQQSGLASISPTSTAANLPPGHTAAFRTVPNETISAKLLADYIVNQRRNKVAIFYTKGSDEESNRYSQPVQEILRTSFDANTNMEGVVKEVNLDDLASDQYDGIINSLEQSINSEQIDTILLAPGRSETSILQALDIAARSRALSDDILIVGNESMHDARTANCGEKINNMVITTFWDMNSASTSVSTVTAEFARKAVSNPNDPNVLWETDANWTSAMAYDAVRAFGKALEIHHPSPNRTKIANSLSNPRFSMDGATGFVKFDNNGDRIGGSVKLLKVLPLDPNSPVGGQHHFQPIFF